MTDSSSIADIVGPVAEGPFTERHAAEANARNRRGVIAERTVTIDFGLWTPSDPRGHV